jgi:O-antigen ligase
MLVVILRKVKNPQSIFTFTLFISVVYSLDALIQFIKGTDIFGIPLCCGIRASGPFSWHSPVIGTFLMTLFFLPEFIVLKKTKKIIIYILFFLGIIVSGCRGALMQILFVLFLFKLNKKQKIFFVLLIIIIVYLLLNYINIDRDAISRLLLIFEPEKMIEYESRSDGRLAFWATYLFTAIKDNILLGAGLGGLESYLSKLTHGHYIHPHHLYLEIVMSLGVVGTFLFILFLFNVYKNTDKKEKFIFWSFWGPFNALHSVFDFYWATMMFFSIMIVLLSKRWRYNRI